MSRIRFISSNPNKPTTDSGGTAWELGGNTIGTDSNKLGTLDDKDLEFITNGIVRFIINGTNGFLTTSNNSVFLEPFEGSLILENIFGATPGTVTINYDQGTTGGAGGSISASGGVDIANQQILFDRSGRVIFNHKQFFEVNGNIRFTETNFADAWFFYDNINKVLQLGSNTVDVALPNLPNLTSLATDATGKIIAGSGGGGATLTTLTVAQLATAISGSTLIAGGFYLITDAETSLYGGTNIILQATSTNTLEPQGKGLFFTPKHDLYNMWSSTGIYAIGDIVIYGGYVWENTTGNAGFVIDDFNLDGADWKKLTYNTTNYNVSWDVIKYDVALNQIYFRADKLGNVIDGVIFGIDIFGNNPIKVFKWGFVGNFENKVNNGYLYCINYSNTNTIFNNTLGNGSAFNSNTLGDGAYFNSNTLGDGAYFYNNNLGDGAYFDGNTLGVGANFYDNTLGNSAYFYSNTLGNSAYFASNILSVNAYFGGNTLGVGANFNVNTLGNGAYFNSNTLGDGAYFYNNNLGDGAYFDGNTLGVGANFYGNTLGNNVSFAENTFKSSAYFKFSSSGILTQNIVGVSVNSGCKVTDDISAATTIYGNFSKTISKRQDGTLRLSYLDNSDVMVYVDVNN